MPQDNTTTTAIVRYPGWVALAGSRLFPSLLPTLKLAGLECHGWQEVPGGIRVSGDDLTVSASAVMGIDGQIRVVVTGGGDDAASARRRFRLCAAVVRYFIRIDTPTRINWHHRGGHYVSRDGRVAVLSPMDGARNRATGSVARDKARARGEGICILPPEHQADATPKAPRAVLKDDAEFDLRIGGAQRLKLPEMASLYAVNATLCVLSLPVGVGLMTYSLLSGGSLDISARVMALTGTAFALTGFLPATLLGGIV